MVVIASLSPKGESVFIPADMGEYILNGTGEFILTTL